MHETVQLPCPYSPFGAAVCCQHDFSSSVERYCGNRWLRPSNIMTHYYDENRVYVEGGKTKTHGRSIGMSSCLHFFYKTL